MTHARLLLDARRWGETAYVLIVRIGGSKSTIGDEAALSRDITLYDLYRNTATHDCVSGNATKGC
jgi:hypothetical protein